MFLFGNSPPSLAALPQVSLTLNGVASSLAQLCCVAIETVFEIETISSRLAYKNAALLRRFYLAPAPIHDQGAMYFDPLQKDSLAGFMLAKMSKPPSLSSNSPHLIFP